MEVQEALQVEVRGTVAETPAAESEADFPILLHGPDCVMSHLVEAHENSKSVALFDHLMAEADIISEIQRPKN